MENNTFTILVVDDEEANRDLLSRNLERNGYRVLMAADGYAALGTIEIETVDLIILDIMMPGIDGLKVLEILREKHSESQLPVIMASATNDSEVIVRALSAGANDYVNKPLDFPIILARVEAQLRNKSDKGSSDPEPEEIAIGAILGGRYQLNELIGSGGFGAVYRARHIELDYDVAVKVLHANLAQDHTILERFKREGVSTCRVQHPNAVSIYDIQITRSGVAYLVMEFLHGLSLAELIEQGTQWLPKRCAEIFIPVCEVLAVAHREGVVHRDIKPANLFLATIGGKETIKVLDFGIAVLTSESESQKLTQTGMLIGSPLYMAPERLLGDPIDARSDIFSLGVVLYYMLSGKLPFPGENMEKILQSLLRGEMQPLDTSVPESLQLIVKSALNSDPNERPDAETFAKLLSAALEGISGVSSHNHHSSFVESDSEPGLDDDMTKVNPLHDSGNVQKSQTDLPASSQIQAQNRATSMTSLVQSNSELSLQSPPSASTGRTAEPDKRAGETINKILLVDENELNSEMLFRRLTRRGYQVLVAIDGADAVAQAHNEKPDLILMDLRLPVMNGWDATRKLKSDKATASIPVIALTADAMYGDRQKALDAGCDDYDTKPVVLPRLLEKMTKLLSQGNKD